jgi:hypothetical protein
MNLMIEVWSVTRWSTWFTFAVRGDDQQGSARPVAAAVRLAAGGAPLAAQPGVGRAVDDRRELVVVPAVGVVVGDDDGG